MTRMSWKYWLYAAVPLAFIIAEAFSELDREPLEGANLLLLKLAMPALIAWVVNVRYTLQEKETPDLFGKVFVSILWILLIMMPFGLPY